MCVMCDITQTFDPDRHAESSTCIFEANPIHQRIFEGTDASADTATSYRIQVGNTFQGDLGTAGDEGWGAIRLTAGETYRLELTGSTGGGGTLNDPNLRLYDNNGNFIVFNDDGGARLDSSMSGTIDTAGIYYLSADSYDNSYSNGTYELFVNIIQPHQPASLNTLASYLTHGFFRDIGLDWRHFDTSTNNEISVNISALTPEGRQLARWALEAWENVTNVDFNVITGSANINFDDTEPGAYTTSITNGNTITSSSVNISSEWLTHYGSSLASYSFQTYVHELGHALGLGHQGYYNGNGDYETDATFSNDSWQLSVMSYFSQTDNPTTNASYATLLTPMMADIIAIQNLYGAPGASSATAGRTIWGANTNLPGYIENFSSVLMGNNPVALTIYDRGGNDTLNLSFSTSGDRIDMRSASFSDIGGLVGNLGIARGTAIENLNAGPGNDSVIGNIVDNNIFGHWGNDTLYGGAGNDTLQGDEGGDILYGGSAADLLKGGIGNDDLRGNRGYDRLIGGAGRDTLFGGAGNDSLYGGGTADLLKGGIGNDDLRGNRGYDRLIGGAGRDTLFGGAGKDILQGGTDDGARDVFVFNSIGHSTRGGSRDVILDFAAGSDDIYLAQIDANTAAAGNQAFIWNGAAARAHGLWTVQSENNRLVRGDINGDRSFDFEIEIRNVASLSTDDFIL